MSTLLQINSSVFSTGGQSSLLADHYAAAWKKTNPSGKVVVFSTRGGLYAGTPSDVETPYVRQFLGFLGMTDVSFVYAEGLAYGDDKKAAAMKAALAETETLAA